MEDLIVSLRNNKLRVSIIEKDVFSRNVLDIPKESVSDTHITNSESLTAFLDQAILGITTLSRKKLSLTFIVEPQDVFMRFVTISKNNGNPVSQVIKEMGEKLDGVSLKELYFSYQKIAPFVYQFIGIKKEYLENYINVSNQLGIELRAVIPWLYLLPKYAAVNDPAVFLSSSNGNQVVALSELNGIYFSEVYEEGKTPKDLQKLIHDLSVYKRKDPIDDIYVFNKETSDLGDIRDVTTLDIPGVEGADIEGFESNLLVKFMLDANPDLTQSLANLVTLIPVPMVAKKNNAMIYAGAFAAALVLIGGVWGISTFLRNRSISREENTQMAMDLQENAVLSESFEESTESEELEETKELNRDELVIRVENGANINGAAASTKELLENLGYSVPEIDTANEVRTDTLLKFKSDKAEFKDMVVEDMREKYPSVVVESDLEEELGYDLLIVLGTSITL